MLQAPATRCVLWRVDDKIDHLEYEIFWHESHHFMKRQSQQSLADCLHFLLPGTLSQLCVMRLDLFLTYVCSGASLLELSNVQIADSGVYTCTSVNSHGTDSRAARLTIQDVPSPPTHITIKKVSRGSERLLLQADLLLPRFVFLQS